MHTLDQSDQCNDCCFLSVRLLSPSENELTAGKHQIIISVWGNVAQLDITIPCQVAVDCAAAVAGDHDVLYYFVVERICLFHNGISLQLE